MAVLATLLKVLGVTWIALGWLLVVALVALAWLRKGFGEVQTMLNPWNFRNALFIGMILGPGLALLHLANAARQRSGRMAVRGALGLCVAAALFIGLVFAAKKTVESGGTNRVHEYKATSLRVLNRSATMHEHKNYYVTMSSGSVGTDGIPDVIKLGDTVTVGAKTIRVRHIFVTEVLDDMKWGREVVAKKGDVTCVIVESEENLPYGDEWRDRLWIHVKECQPLEVSETSARAKEIATDADPEAVYRAIGAGRVENVKRLLTNADSINKPRPGRPGPLFYALMKKQEGVARYLVETGADVNTSVEGVTPLFVAVIEHYIDLARLMINKGADINARQSGKFAGAGTPFFLALGLQTYSEDEIIELFLKGGQRPDVLVEDLHGRSALVWCILNGHSRIAIWSLENGAKVNSVDKQGQTPLQHATYRGEVEITRELLRRKADTEVRDSNELTPIMQALGYFRQSLTSDHRQIAELLIQNGADARAKDRTGNTPLMFAAAVNAVDIAAKMLDRGADVNAQNSNGQTALMAAAIYGYPRMVELLLSRGANSNVRNKDGQTALRFARGNSQGEVETLLRTKGATE
jgi:uncharacterized protein